MTEETHDWVKLADDCYKHTSGALVQQFLYNFDRWYYFFAGATEPAGTCHTLLDAKAAALNTTKHMEPTVAKEKEFTDEEKFYGEVLRKASFETQIQHSKDFYAALARTVREAKYVAPVDSIAAILGKAWESTLPGEGYWENVARAAIALGAKLPAPVEAPALESRGGWHHQGLYGYRHTSGARVILKSDGRWHFYPHDRPRAYGNRDTFEEACSAALCSGK